MNLTTDYKNVQPRLSFPLLSWWQRLWCSHERLYAYYRKEFFGLTTIHYEGAACMRCARVLREKLISSSVKGGDDGEAQQRT